jgi:hypothetical protein
MGFNIKNVAGNVNLSNIMMSSSVIMNSTLSQHLDIGTAITNSVTSSLGTSTDDQVVIKKSNSTTLSDQTTARGSGMSTTNTTSAFDYIQDINHGGIPASGASGGSCTSFMLLGSCFTIGSTLFNKLPGSLQSNSEDNEESEGGYYFY